MKTLFETGFGGCHTGSAGADNPDSQFGHNFKTSFNLKNSLNLTQN
jgi:hypothetical protein